MPANRPSLARSLVLLLFTMLVCGTVWVVGVTALGAPDRAVDEIGPPAPGLDPIQASVLAVYLLARQEALDVPAGLPEASLEVEISPGQTASTVFAQLREAGIVEDPLLLRIYMRYLGLDRSIEAGRYALSGAMTLRQIAETLQSAHPPAVVLTLPEGWRREEIAAAIAEAGLNISPEEFLAATQVRPSAYSFAAQLPEPASLEGFLFPDTYHLDQDATAAEVVLTMLDNFEARVGSDLRSAFEAHGLNLLQAVTLASIIEREAVHPDERPLIASVFLNRLAVGMKLEADPTVQYAVGLQPDGQWWKRSLTFEDLSFDSPYNTYVYPGLPPGPIANPGLSSLQAVALPADSPYFYFRAACDGSGRHVFAVSFEEHLANACP